VQLPTTHISYTPISANPSTPLSSRPRPDRVVNRRFYFYTVTSFDVQALKIFSFGTSSIDDYSVYSSSPNLLSSLVLMHLKTQEFASRTAFARAAS